MHLQALIVRPARLALLLGASLLPPPALAVDATWLGNGAPTPDAWNQTNNWSAGLLPTGTATFANNGAPTSVTIGAGTNVSLNAIQFNAGAPAYTINVGAEPGGRTLTLNGAGFVNNSGNVQTIVFLGPNAGLGTASLIFNNASTAGTVSIINDTAGTGFVRFFNTSSAANATIINSLASFVSFADSSTAGSATINNSVSAQLIFSNNATAGNAVINNSLGFVIFGGSSTAGNATLTTDGTTGFSGGAIRFNGNSTGGTARFIANAGGVVDFSASTGPNGDSKLTAGSIEGVGAYYLGANQLTVGSNNLSTTVSGVISDCGTGAQCQTPATGGALVKVGTGTLTLAGANTYTGATLVNAGTLLVTGSLTSAVTVAPGAILGGTGTVSAPVVAPRQGPEPGAAPATLVTVNGTLAPGASASQIGTFTVNGNLVFGPTGILLSKVQGPTADLVNVTGTAALAGTLKLVTLSNGLTFNTAYTVLHTTAGRSGTFGTVDLTQVGAGLVPTVSYTGTDVQVTFTPAPLTPLVPPTPAQTPTFGLTSPRNPASVAQGIDRAVLVFGANATPLFTLYNLPAGQTAVGVNALSGEVHTSVAAIGVDEGSGFLRVMLDPFAVGRGAGVSPTLAYADSAIVNPALGAVDQAADLAGPAPLDARRFAVWGAAFGSTGHTNGDAGIGSSRRQLSDANLAVGVDVRLDPQTVIGFAAAGGGAHASLDNGLGSASADVWQIGAYVMRRDGPWSLGAAMAYSWLGVDTTRQVFVLAVPSLNAHYTAHGFSGRIEGAYEVGQWSGLAIAPFAAFEGHAVNSPAFLETNLVGAPIGLAGQSHTNTTTRTELGLKLDGKTVMMGMDVTSFAKLAWAHYFDRDAVLNASLVGFAGSNFTVLGARPDRDSALLSAGLDVKLTPLISLGGRIDGELSGNVAQVSGSARLRVAF